MCGLSDGETSSGWDEEEFDPDGSSGTWTQKRSRQYGTGNGEYGSVGLSKDPIVPVAQFYVA
jgi:hypothetical protein